MLLWAKNKRNHYREGSLDMWWIRVVSYLIERTSGLGNNKMNKDNNGFSTKNNRKYNTIQPMKYSVQQEVRPYPLISITFHQLWSQISLKVLIPLRSNKHSKECFIGYPNTSKLVFGYAMKHSFSCLIYYRKACWSHICLFLNNFIKINGSWCSYMYEHWSNIGTLNVVNASDAMSKVDISTYSKNL